MFHREANHTSLVLGSILAETLAMQMPAEKSQRIPFRDLQFPFSRSSSLDWWWTETSVFFSMRKAENSKTSLNNNFKQSGNWWQSLKTQDKNLEEKKTFICKQLRAHSDISYKPKYNIISKRKQWFQFWYQLDITHIKLKNTMKWVNWHNTHNNQQNRYKTINC